ncbi:ABC transporter ATP-binding protein [Fodinicurvata sediminis]|uniref:ABC transporter ATP-binding protein n=1 Tax=Fodinicurvata sediminis TaxID=1121832 RepID=UPI0003B74E31|nr:ABC transporter ATP-binding protein [Fodinicurvata sediminis]
MSVELVEVSKVVGSETHIRSVSMKLEAGSLNILLGPTLSGKTSLMRLMAGLDEPTSGRIFANDRDVTGIPVRKRDVAMVYQQFINYPTLTVYENIASPLRVAKRPKAEIDSKVKEAADLLKITAMLDRTPLELSGGQQQRTALARALVKGAELVLLDEPLANLDYKLREELREELPRVFSESGTVLVYATTEPTEALLLGGNTATLHEGSVTQFGPTLDVYRRPHDLLTAQVFSDPPMNLMQVQLAGGQLQLADGQHMPVAGLLQGLPDGRYTLGMRPNHLALERPTEGAVEVTAEVTVTEITGSESFVHVGFAGERWVVLAHGVRDLSAGDRVPVYIDAERLFIFDAEQRLKAAPGLQAAA